MQNESPQWARRVKLKACGRHLTSHIDHALRLAAFNKRARKRLEPTACSKNEQALGQANCPPVSTTIFDAVSEASPQGFSLCFIFHIMQRV
jgi:hypothetical protein